MESRRDRHGDIGLRSVSVSVSVSVAGGDGGPLSGGSLCGTPSGPTAPPFTYATSSVGAMHSGTRVVKIVRASSGDGMFCVQLEIWGKFRRATRHDQQKVVRGWGGDPRSVRLSQWRQLGTEQASDWPA
jgi:hypothetical protein